MKKRHKHARYRDLVILNEHGWMNYEAERRMNDILRTRLRATQERLARYEWSMEHQS